MKKILAGFIVGLAVAFGAVYMLFMRQDPEVAGKVDQMIFVSPEAREILKAPIPPQPDVSVETMRKFTDSFQADFSAKQLLKYPVTVKEDSIGGVPVRVLEPKQNLHPKQILLNAHGGGFMLDAGTLSENIPLADLTHRTVVAVKYRLVPESKYPAARDDIIAVYQELLKTHEAKDIVIYGTSAGAFLTAQVLVRLKQLNLPLPAAAGIFSGAGSLEAAGESMLRMNPLIPMLSDKMVKASFDGYRGDVDPKDPMLSPIYGDLHGLPPVLLLSGTRDMLLSGTIILHRALLKADVDADLVVFEGMSHAHWMCQETPEATEAFEIMAKYFDRHLTPKEG